MYPQQFVNSQFSPDPLAFLWEPTPTAPVKPSAPASPYFTIDERLSFLWPDIDSAPIYQLPTGSEKLTTEEQAIAAALCGKCFGASYMPATGDRRVKRFRCHYFRLCDDCLVARAGLLRRRVETAIRIAESAGLKIRTITTDDTRPIARKFGKENYISCPLVDGSTQMFIRCDADYAIGEEIGIYGLHAIDWKALALSPENRNFSGKLGQDEHKPGTADGVEDPNAPQPLSMPEVVIGGVSQAQMNQALDDAIKLTDHLRPKSILEVEQALRERVQKYVELCSAIGGRVAFIRNITQVVKPADIDWSTQKAFTPIEWSDLNPAPF